MAALLSRTGSQRAVVRSRVGLTKLVYPGAQRRHVDGARRRMARHTSSAWRCAPGPGDDLLAVAEASSSRRGAATWSRDDLHSRGVDPGDV